MGLISLFKKSDGNENIRKVYKQLPSTEKRLFDNSYSLFEETILDILEIFSDNLIFIGGFSSILEIKQAYFFTLKKCAQLKQPYHMVAKEVKETFPLFDSITLAKHFVAYSLLKASHADFRLNQPNGRESISLLVNEMEPPTVRKVQSMLCGIVDERKGSENEYFEYLLRNNTRGIPKEEIKAFVGIMAYSDHHSITDTVDVFKEYIEELIEATPLTSIRSVTGLIDICSFFCGLLNGNGIITESEMKELSEKYTQIIATRKLESEFGTSTFDTTGSH